MTQRQVQFIMEQMRFYTFNEYKNRWYHKTLDPQHTRGATIQQLFDDLCIEHKDELLFLLKDKLK